MTQPYRPDGDDPVSTFEELDSFEIPARRAEAAARTYRREAFIGIGVLVVLAAIAFSQWRQTQAVQDTYHAGARAAAAYDWPAAQRAFSSIPGYWDSNLRAADAAKMITYTLALSGTVAVRTQGASPGLYYNGLGGWHYLPGSDLQSRVLASCPNGDLVYDGAVPGPGEPPTPEPGALPPRRVLVATRQGQLVADPLINATFFEQFICSAKGVWATRTINAQLGIQASHPIAAELDGRYAEFGTGRTLDTADLKASFPSSSMIVSALMPDEEHVLVSDLSGVTGPGDNWHTKLYVMDIYGGKEVFLGSFPGAPGPLPYSAVGNSLLLTMYYPTREEGGYINSVFLVGPEGEPRELITADIKAEVPDDHFRMSVVGINSGVRAGQVLVYWPQSVYSVVALIDTTKPSVEPLRLETGPLVFVNRVLSVDSESGTILLGVTDGSVSSSTNIIYIDAKNNQRELNLINSSRPGGAAEAWVRKGRLVFSSGMIHLAGSSPTSGPFAYVFQSLPVDRLPDTQESTVLSWIAVPGILPAVGLPWHVGPDMFAYITPAGEVRAANYDGTGDILLDKGVALFSEFDNDGP